MMPDIIKKDDVKKIVALVGREGTICALEKSTKITMQELLLLARELQINIAKKSTKKKLSEQIVRYIDKRINKSIDELKSMTKEALIDYFHNVECDQEELFELLEKIDFKAKAKSKRALIEYAAIQIQSLGVFERISDPDEKKKPNE